MYEAVSGIWGPEAKSFKFFSNQFNIKLIFEILKNTLTLYTGVTQENLKRNTLHWMCSVRCICIL
jgi:hypothetical protein